MVNRGPLVPRARSRTRLIALITLIALTTAGLGAEAVARASVTGNIEVAARSALHTRDLEVTLGTAPALLDVLSGSITTVSIDAESATVCRLADFDVAAIVHDLSTPRDESRLAPDSGPGHSVQGNGQQHHCILKGFQVVPHGRDHDMVARAAVPRVPTGVQPDRAAQYLQRRLAGALVLAEATTSDQRDQGLAQRTALLAVHGVRAATGAVSASDGQVFLSEGGQGGAIHLGFSIIGFGAAAIARATTSASEQKPDRERLRQTRPRRVLPASTTATRRILVWMSLA